MRIFRMLLLKHFFVLSVVVFPRILTIDEACSAGVMFPLLGEEQNREYHSIFDTGNRVSLGSYRQSGDRVIGKSGKTRPSWKLAVTTITPAPRGPVNAKLTVP